MLFVSVAVQFMVLYTSVEGHGRLTEPPSRSSMWRFGFNNPKNTDDTSGFCGGFQTQWNVHGGKCGICGDSLSDTPPRANEAGGKYGNGIIVRKYHAGQTIDIKTELTANHKGWYEYRLCQNDDPKATLEQECFDKHLLEGEDGQTRFTITSQMRHVTHRVKLPAGLRCKDCVLQWKYNTGNSWGTDPDTGEQCGGCGPQETFQACADIAIEHDDVETGATDNQEKADEGDNDDHVEGEGVNDFQEYDANGNCNCNAAGSTAMCHFLPTRRWSNRH